jgi:hypothetical protein
LRSSTLKPASARTYQVRDDGRTATDKGTGQPLYFLDDYQTLVTKHDGFYDKKTDVRQPDFIGYIDTLSGKLRHSQPITDLPGTFQWAKLREKHPEPLFITVDPQRDSPAVLKQFVSAFHPRLTGLTGTDKQISEVARAFAVHYERVKGSSPTTYLMSHSQTPYLMGPDGKPLALLPADTPNTEANEGDPKLVAAELGKWVR